MAAMNFSFFYKELIEQFMESDEETTISLSDRLEEISEDEVDNKIEDIYLIFNEGYLNAVKRYFKVYGNQYNYSKHVDRFSLWFYSEGIRVLNQMSRIITNRDHDTNLMVYYTIDSIAYTMMSTLACEDFYAIQNSLYRTPTVILEEFRDYAKENEACKNKYSNQSHYYKSFQIDQMQEEQIETPKYLIKCEVKSFNDNKLLCS
jgi:hypothetical protein